MKEYNQLRKEQYNSGSFMWKMRNSKLTKLINDDIKKILKN